MFHTVVRPRGRVPALVRTAWAQPGAAADRPNSTHPRAADIPRRTVIAQGYRKAQLESQARTACVANGHTLHATQAGKLQDPSTTLECVLGFNFAERAALRFLTSFLRRSVKLNECK